MARKSMRYTLKASNTDKGWKKQKTVKNDIENQKRTIKPNLNTQSIDSTTQGAEIPDLSYVRTELKMIILVTVICLTVLVILYFSLR